jgi:hypothetical protein
VHVSCQSSCQSSLQEYPRTIHRPRESETNGTLDETREISPPLQPNGSPSAEHVCDDPPAAVPSSAPASVRAEGLTTPAAEGSYHHPTPEQYSTIANLPPYIQNLPSTLGSEDLDYLAAKGVFTLPDRYSLSICLCRYIEFVHPVLPLLNLNDTLMSMDDNTGKSGKTSLLLFFAIIYSALPFLETKHVRVAGYSSKLEARTAIYKKAKVSTIMYTSQ